MGKAIKLLISGFESSGKSTLASQIENALVINFDHKQYEFKVPHVNIPHYNGMDDLINTINEKVVAYQDKFGKLPDTIIFDTVTQLYTSIQKYSNDKYTGFNIHSAINKDTLDFNGYVEDTLIANDVNVVIIAHTMYDPDTARHIIPASGQFAKAGSWLSIVGNSIFIEKKSGKLIVHQNSLKFPARTTLPKMEPFVTMEEYDINEHINRLANAKNEALEFEL